MDQAVLALHFGHNSIAAVHLSQPNSNLQACCAVNHMAWFSCRPAVQMIGADLSGVLKPIEGYLRTGVRVVVDCNQPLDSSATRRLAALNEALQLLGCSEAAVVIKSPACIHIAVKRMATDLVSEKTKQVPQWSQQSKARLEAMTTVLTHSTQFALTEAAQQELEDLKSRGADRVVPVADAFWLAAHEMGQHAVGPRLQQQQQQEGRQQPELSGSSRDSGTVSESSATAAVHGSCRLRTNHSRTAASVLAAAAAQQIDEARAASAAVQNALRSIKGINTRRGFRLQNPPAAPAAGDSASMSAAAAAAAAAGGGHPGGVSDASTIAAHPAAEAAAAAAAAAAADTTAKSAGAKWWQKPAAAVMAAATAAVPAGIPAKSDTAAAAPPAAGTSSGTVQPQQLPHKAAAPQQQLQQQQELRVLQPIPLLALPLQQQQQQLQLQLCPSVRQAPTGICIAQSQQHNQQENQQPQQRAIALLQQQLQKHAAAKGQPADAMHRQVRQPSAAAAAAAAAANPESSGPGHTRRGWGASALGSCSQAGAGRSSGQAGVKRAAAAMLEGAGTHPGGLQLPDAAAPTFWRVNSQSQTSCSPAPEEAAAPAAAAAAATPAKAATGACGAGDSGSQPAAPGSGAAAGTVGLSSIAQLVLGCLQQGSLGLEPGAAESLLQSSGLAGMTAEPQFRQQLQLQQQPQQAQQVQHHHLLPNPAGVDLHHPPGPHGQLQAQQPQGKWGQQPRQHQQARLDGYGSGSSGSGSGRGAAPASGPAAAGLHDGTGLIGSFGLPPGRHYGQRNDAGNSSGGASGSSLQDSLLPQQTAAISGQGWLPGATMRHAENAAALAAFSQAPNAARASDGSPLNASHAAHDLWGSSNGSSGSSSAGGGGRRNGAAGGGRSGGGIISSLGGRGGGSGGISRGPADAGASRGPDGRPGALKRASSADAAAWEVPMKRAAQEPGASAGAGTGQGQQQLSLRAGMGEAAAAAGAAAPQLVSAWPQDASAGQGVLAALAAAHTNTTTCSAGAVAPGMTGGSIVPMAAGELQQQQQQHQQAKAQQQQPLKRHIKCGQNVPGHEARAAANTAAAAAAAASMAVAPGNPKDLSTTAGVPAAAASAAAAAASGGGSGSHSPAAPHTCDPRRAAMAAGAAPAAADWVWGAPDQGEAAVMGAQGGSNQQQQVHHMVPADPMLGIAADAPAAMSVSLLVLKDYWQRLVDLGQLLLTGEGLAFFVQEFSLPVRAGPAGMGAFKCQLMGSHTAAIADAVELQEAVDWVQDISWLQQQVGPGQLVFGEITYGDSWKNPPGHLVKSGKVPRGHAYQTVTGTVLVTLPASRQQQHAQVSNYLLSTDNDFANKQQPDAAYLRVSVKVSADSACHPKKQQAALFQQKRAQLIEKVQAKLPSTTAALLKWQLQWQLRGQQRQLLEQGGFGQLVVAPDAGAPLPCAPSMGMSAKLNLAGA